MPVVASTIATSIIFLVIFDPNFGLANWALGGVGLGPYGFLQDPDQALYAIVALTVWGWLGFNVIIYLAALQGIPRRARRGGVDRRGERAGARSAASCSRCSARRRCSSSVWSTINALQLFDEVYFLTKGGPLYSTYVRRLLRLRPGLPEGARRLRRGRRLHPVRGDPGADRAPARDRAADGALLVVSTVPHKPTPARTAAALAAVRPLAPRARADRARHADAAPLDARHLARDGRRRPASSRR